METMPKPLQSQPFPIASISGTATMAPIHENIFRTKLFKAIPLEALLGMNSVNIVEVVAKTIMLPMPKKKFAIN